MDRVRTRDHKVMSRVVESVCWRVSLGISEGEEQKRDEKEGLAAYTRQ